MHARLELSMEMSRFASPGFGQLMMLAERPTSDGEGQIRSAMVVHSVAEFNDCGQAIKPHGRHR